MRKTQTNSLLKIIKNSKSRDARGNTLYCYKCACGRKKVLRKSQVDNKYILSCGCLKKTSNKNHGMSHTKIYYIWRGMLERCYDKNNKAFKNYGERGITVCDEWRSCFDNFYRDMGDKPKGMSLDRIDNNKGYSKDNCRWATHVEQCNNTRSNIYITAYGLNLTVLQWAQAFEVPSKRIYHRISRGWDKFDAVFTGRIL